MKDREALGRLPGEPVAIVDIGSNSVRLVAYEALSRSPTTTFNEKVLCGLGRGVATTGLLPEDGVAKALIALKRFRVLCDIMEIRDVRALATAAVRDAGNGPQFLALAEQALGYPIHMLAGQHEARLAALGVLSSIYNADGVVGDLGGGSLEMTDIADGRVGQGVTLPLGGLSLMDVSERSPRKAARIAREALARARALGGAQGPRVLCGRRHLARAGAAAHAPARLSDARDAQLRHPVARRAGIRQARRAHRGRRAAGDRERLLGAPPAARLWRGGARGDRPPVGAARDRHLCARRARRAALREPVAEPTRPRIR